MNIDSEYLQTIKLPGEPSEAKSYHNFIIVGANGSGKSHLGAWIEKNTDNSLRISAQRALSLPDSVVVRSEKEAWLQIMNGSADSQNKIIKWNNWKESTIKLINDYGSYCLLYLQRITRKIKITLNLVSRQKKLGMKSLKYLK